MWSWSCDMLRCGSFGIDLVDFRRKLMFFRRPPRSGPEPVGPRERWKGDVFSFFLASSWICRLTNIFLGDPLSWGFLVGWFWNRWTYFYWLAFCRYIPFPDFNQVPAFCCKCRRIEMPGVFVRLSVSSRWWRSNQKISPHEQLTSLTKDSPTYSGVPGPVQQHGKLQKGFERHLGTGTQAVWYRTSLFTEIIIIIIIIIIISLDSILPQRDTPWKFSIAPPKSYPHPIGKDRLPTIQFQGLC